MQKQVIFEIAKIREMSFFKTARAALLSIFPFVLIGSFAKVATVALLAPDSFLSGIFGMELSQRFNSLFNGVYAMTGGLSGLLAAHYAAGYTAQFLRQNYKTAATTGFIAYLALCFQQAGQSHGFVFAYRLLGVQGILAGIMFGYVVGKLFLLSGEFWSKVEGREGADQQLPGSFRMLLPLFLALAFAIILNFAGSFLFKNGISQSQEMKVATSSFPSILWLGLLTSVGTWCGLFGPYTSNSFFDEVSATKNLNYALAHHGDLTSVPSDDLFDVLCLCSACWSGSVACFDVCFEKKKSTFALLVVSDSGLFRLRFSIKYRDAGLAQSAVFDTLCFGSATEHGDRL